MLPLFKKLNLGTHERICVLNAPASFESELAMLASVNVQRAVSGPVRFALAFVVTQPQLDVTSQQLVDAADGDALLWMAYPKGTSKRYRCEFNRDSGWSVLGANGYEAVRMVAVDEDWSAVRFRQVAYIQSMKRRADSAISAAGRRKAAGR
jgi:hypothetical protein